MNPALNVMSGERYDIEVLFRTNKCVPNENESDEIRFV